MSTANGFGVRGLSLTHASKEIDHVLRELERSKYAIRIVLLLHRHREMSLTGILRSIPTSPPTVIRSLRILEKHGFVASMREVDGRKRHLYSLTNLGLVVAEHPPVEWDTV